MYPGVYYIMEDIIAVNAGAGRPFREALAARYAASPRFRRMIKTQSLFWSIPSLVVAVVCTVVIVIHPVSKEVAYGVGTFLTSLLSANLLTHSIRMGCSVCLGRYMGRHLFPLDPP